MAYVNVAEWKPDQVTDWLKGLDSVVIPYIHSFLNNQVNGQQVLNLGPDDLEHLGVYKLGHQELILEAVEYLRNFHYELDRETLQILALRLSCLAHSLHNELNKNHMDSLLVSTQTLADVANIVTAVKPLVCWLDRPPFSGQLEYSAKKSELLSLSLEMATCGQRDRFAERPVEEIRTSSKRLAELADSIIQDIQDPLILQPASLELVTLKKRSSDDLGFYIVPSFHGIHQIGALKCNSAAHQCGKLEAGDEIVQINYQTVVGWQLKQVIALFEESPTEVLLTVKKRPRHTKVYGQIYMKPYRLPSKKRATQNSFTRWHDNLPSPRPELLTIPDFEMPAPKSVPGILESTVNTSLSGRLPSSSEEEGECLDVGVTSSPTSVRLYLPKPRLPVQRRATITGASPLSKRAPVNLQQFWEELKLEREWRCGGAGGTMREKPCVAQLIQDCESRVSCTRKYSSFDSLKDRSGGCFLQDSKPDVVSSCHGKEKCFGSDEYIKSGYSLEHKLSSENSGQNSGSTSTYKTSSGSEENIFRNCDTLEKSSETDDVFKTVDTNISSKQDVKFEQCRNVDSSDSSTGMNIRQLDSIDKVSFEIKNEIEEGKVSSLKAKIELFSKGVETEKQRNFISPGIDRGNKPKVPVRTFRLSPEKPISPKVQATAIKDGAGSKSTGDSNVIVRHEGIRKERGRLDKSHSTPAYDFSAELSYVDGKLQNIFKYEKSPKQTKTDSSFRAEAKTESPCEDSKNVGDFGKKLDEKCTGIIHTGGKNLDKPEHEVHGQIVETINKHILQMDDEGDGEPKWKDKTTGTNLDNDQINEENETEEKIGKILENINSSLVERRKEMERESKSRKNLSEEMSVQETVSDVHHEETSQHYSSLDNDKTAEEDHESKVKTVSVPVPPRVRVTPPTIPEETRTLPDVTMTNNTPSVILESPKRKPVSEFDYVEKPSPPAPATFPRQKPDTRRPLTPPEPPPRPTPPAPAQPHQQTQQKGACYRAMMVARSMGKSATHKAASMTSPKSHRKKNLLLAKHRNVSVKDIGPCECQGWLQQRCRKGSGQWNRGWFVIKGTTFYGFKSKEAHKADVMISLPGFTVSLAEEVKSRKYAFKVYHTGTMFYFAADNQEELTAWVDSVTMATLTTQDTHSDTVLFSESEGEVSGEEGGAESCFPSPKMKKLAGLLSSPTKTTANASTTHSASEKSHESQKIFGSLKKLRHKNGDHGDNTSENSGGGASLDRKFNLGFLGRGPSVVPTAQFRSYRRVAPPLPRTHHQSAESVLTLDTSGNTMFAEGLQCSPHGQLQISPGLPANHNLPPDMADYRLASLSKNRRRGGEEQDTTGFVTLEALMLSRQEEERRTQTHFHAPEVPQSRAPPPPVSQRNIQVGHQNGPETSRTIQPSTQPRILSRHAVSSVTPIIQSRPSHIRSTSAACGGQSLVGPTPSPAMNHLLLGKCALVNNRGRRLGPPPGAVPPPHRTKESATDYLEKVHDGLDLPHNESKSMEPVSSPVSPQSSRRDSSSSTSTELCDDPQLSDSEDKTSSFNECSVVLDPISGDTSDSKARGSGDLNTQSLPYSVVTDKENMQKFHENVIEDNTMKKNDDGIPHTSSTEFFNFKIDPKEIKELDRKLSLKIEEIEREKRRKSFNNLENQELIDSMVLFPFDRDYIKDNDVILEDSAEDIKEQALFFSGKKYIKDTLPNWSQNNKLQNKVTAVSDASTNQSHKVTTDSCELTSDNCDIIQSSESEVIVDYNWCKSNFKNAEEESMKIDYSKLEHVNYEYRMKFESDQHHRSDHLQVSNTFHKLYDEDKVLVSLKGEVQSTSNKNQQALETKFLTDENIPELKHFQTTDEYTTETFLMKNIESHASRNEPDLPEKKTKSTSRRGSEVALSLILEENSQILSKFHQKSKKITTTSSDKRLEYSKDICMDKMKIIKQNKLHSHLLESTMERTEGHVTDDKESCKVRLSTKLIKGIVPDTSKTEDTTDMTKKCDNITLSGEQDSKRFVKENVNNTLSHTFENVGSFRRKTTLESDETDSQNFVRDKSPVNISAANQYLNLFQKDYMNMGTTNLKYPIENMTKNSGYEIKSSNLDVNDEFSFSEDRLPDVCPLSLFVKTDASHLSFLESRSNNEDKAGASRDASKKDICEVDSTSAVQFHTVVTNEGITRFAECKSLQENQFYKKQSTETTPEYFSKFSDNIFNKPDFKKFSHSLELTTDRKSIISKTENEKSNLENSSDTDESYSQYHVKYSRQKTDSTSTFLKEPIFESEQKLGCSFPSLCQNNDDTNTSDSSSTFDSTLEKNEAGDKLKPNSRFRYRSESVCNDTEISYTSTSPTVFNPFPSRVSARPPKELGVKLGLYLPSKTCKLPNKNNT